MTVALGHRGSIKIHPRLVDLNELSSQARLAVEAYVPLPP